MNIPAAHNDMNFTSRSLQIRQLDDLMRYTNNQFPRLSESKALCRVNQMLIKSTKFKENKTFLEQLKGVFKKLQQKRLNMRATRTAYDTNYLEYLKDTIRQVQAEKQGNCGESASLMLAVLKSNGIENAQKVALSCHLGNSRLLNGFDHSFVLVNLDRNAELSNPKTYGKKAIVVDAWSGVVDYAANAFKQFESNYSVPIFNIPFSQGKKHGYRLGCFSDGQTLSVSQAQELIKLNPFLNKTIHT